jgi:hypothetical protein
VAALKTFYCAAESYEKRPRVKIIFVVRPITQSLPGITPSIERRNGLKVQITFRLFSLVTSPVFCFSVYNAKCA